MADVTDMRGYIEVLKEMGELRELDGADLDLEVGALTERAAEKEGDALLFNNFKNYPSGFRVITNVFRTCKRTGPAMGIAAQNGIDFLHEWRKKLAAYKPVPVQQVEGGPVMKNQMVDDEVDLYKFPTPKWHDLDGGPFIGTGCGVITKDLDTGKINVGTYRVMVQDKNHVSVKMNMGKHGRLSFERARDAGKPLPIAITLDRHAGDELDEQGPEREGEGVADRLMIVRAGQQLRVVAESDPTRLAGQIVQRGAAQPDRLHERPGDQADHQEHHRQHERIGDGPVAPEDCLQSSVLRPCAPARSNARQRLVSHRDHAPRSDAREHLRPRRTRAVRAASPR
jgi:hypothetical protein